jgi:uncharacterized protein (DUF488 family)
MIPNVWSIGHSNISFVDLLARLTSQEIEVVADVRSMPYSRYTPHFNRDNLEKLLREQGLEYLFMGESLGGRPPEPELYDAEGHVLYRELAKNFRFRNGVDQLCITAESKRVAMMCSEESPEHCHRRLLIGRVLFEQGVDVLHIHGNLAVKTDSELRRIHGPHEVVTLFGVEEDPWRSIRPVLRSGPQSDSFSD